MQNVSTCPWCVLLISVVMRDVKPPSGHGDGFRSHYSRSDLRMNYIYTVNVQSDPFSIQIQPSWLDDFQGDCGILKYKMKVPLAVIWTCGGSWWTFGYRVKAVPELCHADSRQAEQLRRSREKLPLTQRIRQIRPSNVTSESFQKA